MEFIRTQEALEAGMGFQPAKGRLNQTPFAAVRAELEAEVSSLGTLLKREVDADDPAALETLVEMSEDSLQPLINVDDDTQEGTM